MVSNIYPPGSGFPNSTFSPKPPPQKNSPNPPSGLPSSFGGAGTGSGGVSPAGGGPAMGSGGSPMSTGPSPSYQTPRPSSIGGGGPSSFGGGGPSGNPVSGPVSPPSSGPSSGPIISPPTSPSSVSTPSGPPPSTTSGPPSKGPAISGPGTPSGTSVGPGAAPSAMGQNMGSSRGLPPPPSTTTSGTGPGDGSSSTTAPTPGSGTGTGGGLQQKQRNGPATGDDYVPPKNNQNADSKQQQQNSAQKTAAEIKKSIPSVTGNATNPPQLKKPPNETGNASTDEQINNAAKNAKNSTDGSDGADSDQARTRGEVEKINNAANEAQKNAQNNPKSNCSDCGTDTKGPGDLDTDSIDGINDVAEGDKDEFTDSDSGDKTVPEGEQGDDSGTDGVTTPEETPDYNVPWEYVQSNNDLSAFQWSIGQNHSKKKTDPNDPYGGYFADSANTVDAVADDLLGGGSDFRQNQGESLADSLFRWQQDPNRDYDPGGKADWVFAGRGSYQSFMHNKGYNTYGALDDFGNDSATGPAIGLKGSEQTSSKDVTVVDIEVGFGARRMDTDTGDIQGMSIAGHFSGPIGEGASDFSRFTNTQPNYGASIAFSVTTDNLSPVNAPGKILDAAVGVTTQLGSQVADNYRNNGLLGGTANIVKGGLKGAAQIGLGFLGLNK